MINNLVNQEVKRNLKEAAEAGFDVARSWFHGGKSSPIQEVDPSKFGSVTGTPAAKEAFFLVDNPKIAQQYADNAKGSVHEFFYRPEGTATIDWQELFPGLSVRSNNGQRALAGLLQDAKDQGFAGLMIRNSDDSAKSSSESGNVLAVLDPTRLRYPNAKFKDNSSRNTMAGISGVAATGGAIASMAPESASAASLPEGFTLDQSAPDLPAGFVLDSTSTGGQAAMTAEPNTTAKGGRTENARRLLRKREHQEEQMRQQSAQMGIPYARDLEEVGSAPEMNELSKNALKASAGTSFTFDDEEVGNILQKQLGAEIKQDAEGNFVAVMPSGEAYAVNLPGLSGQDAAKFLTAAAAFTPAGAARSLGGKVLGGMVTQGAIEGGQQSIGGEVNPGEVLIAGAAPVVLAGAGKVAKAIFNRFSSKSPVVNEYLDEQLKGGARAAAGMTDDAAKVGQTQTMGGMAPRFREGAKKAEIRQAMKEGTVGAAGYRLDQNGRIVADKVQRELIQKGVSDKVLAASNNFSKGDKQASLRMLDKAEAFIKGVKGAEIDRPQAVIGENAMKRFEVIKNAQKDASKRITVAIDDELRGKPIDISSALDEFMTKLDDLGIQQEGDRLNFKESLVRGSNTTPIRNIYEMVKSSYDDAAELHRVKQAITNQINYEATVGKPIDREAENALKALRSQINEALRNASPKYAKANDDYAKAAQVLKPWAESMGRKFDPESARVENFVGQELRKTITNYAKANELIENLDLLNRTAQEFGGKFDDDLMAQVMLNSELERVLGSFAPGSLQGNLEKSGNIVMERFLGNTAASAVKMGLNEAKNRVMFEAPSKQKLEVIRQLREIYSR